MAKATHPRRSKAQWTKLIEDKQHSPLSIEAYCEQQVWLYTQPTDMRKQFDGLAALAQTKMDCQTASGELFVFINRRRTHMKVLYYSSGGFCLWSKCQTKKQRSDNDVNETGLRFDDSVQTKIIDVPAPL